MPCDTIQRSTVELLAISTDINLLADAFISLGFQIQLTATGLSFAKYGCSGTYNKATGKLDARGYEGLEIDSVKRAYSEQVVTNQAKRHGWKVSWKTNDAGNREAEVEKRA